METNRKYFSWSQYNLWHSSKYSFYKRYFLREEGFASQHMEKGKEFSDYRDTGIVNANIDCTLLSVVSNAIPRLDTTELEINVKYEKTNLKGFIDEAKDDGSEFAEYKTGMHPWTQKDVENHKQLDFYAALIYLKYGVIPKCKLYWIETEKVNINGESKLAYTGYVKCFVKEIKEEDIVNMLVSVNLTLAEINDYEFEEIEVEKETSDRISYLYHEIKKLEKEFAIEKIKIINQMKEFKVSRATCKAGTFSISKRKNYVFSTKLIEKQKKYQDEIDKLMAREKKDPSTKINYTESVSFRVAKNNK